MTKTREVIKKMIRKIIEEGSEVVLVIITIMRRGIKLLEKMIEIVSN